MDAREIIDRYRNGIAFACGCTERGMHPAVERALLTGALSPGALELCPVHRKPMAITDPVTGGVAPGEPAVFA